MGLFSKETCDVCGKESRLSILKLTDGDKTKSICVDCVDAMHCTGLIEYFSYIGRKDITYPMLQEYEKKYETIINHPEYQHNTPDCPVPGIAEILGGVLLSQDIVVHGKFKDLVVESKDIFAITLDSVEKDLSSGVFMLTFFTRNPMVPYFPCIFASKKKLFSLTNKTKTIYQIVKELISAFFEDKDLDYEIMTSKELKKIIKKSEDYASPIDKKEFLNMLSEIHDGYGKFNPKKVNVLTPKNADWAMELFSKMGNEIH